jgi:hypothetical protein
MLMMLILDAAAVSGRMRLLKSLETVFVGLLSVLLMGLTLRKISLRSTGMIFPRLALH